MCFLLPPGGGAGCRLGHWSAEQFLVGFCFCFCFFVPEESLIDGTSKSSKQAPNTQPPPQKEVYGKNLKMIVIIFNAFIFLIG